MNSDLASLFEQDWSVVQNARGLPDGLPGVTHGDVVSFERRDDTVLVTKAGGGEVGTLSTGELAFGYESAAGIGWVSRGQDVLANLRPAGTRHAPRPATDFDPSDIPPEAVWRAQGRWRVVATEDAEEVGAGDEVIVGLGEHQLIVASATDRHPLLWLPYGEVTASAAPGGLLGLADPLGLLATLERLDGPEVRSLLEVLAERRRSVAQAPPLDQTEAPEAAGPGHEGRGDLAPLEVPPPVAFCPRCGTPRVGGFAFCGACGLAFESVGAGATATVAPETGWLDTVREPTRGVRNETIAGAAWFVSAVLIGLLAIEQLSAVGAVVRLQALDQQLGVTYTGASQSDLQTSAVWNGVVACLTAFAAFRLFRDPTDFVLKLSISWAVVNVIGGIVEVANGVSTVAFLAATVVMAAAGIASFAALRERRSELDAP
jgi:hypothetical protein